MFANTRTREETERLLMLALFARIDITAMAVAVAVLGAGGLALATAILLLVGAPLGVPVGPNLGALATFLPGYHVTWAGAAIGALYGAAGGLVLGFLLATFWNFVHLVMLGTVALRGQRF